MQIRTHLALTIAAIGALAAGGCLFDQVPGYYEGGSRASNDLHTYVSREHSPKTVSLVNTTTGEVLWSVDIPVGKQLVVKFVDGKHKDDPGNPSEMRWALMDEQIYGPKLDNEMRVPGPNQRRLDLELRDAPEMAPEVVADTEG